MAEIFTELLALVNSPQESLNIEVKRWIDLGDKAGAATIAKAAIALANHGGGFILLGFEELSDGSFRVGQPVPPALDAYSQDAIARIVASYAEPSFQVQVTHIRRSGTDGTVHPVVIVPGSHRVPIQAKKGSPDQKTLIAGRVYIRRPTPESAEPATAADWRDLFDRCIRAGRDDLLDAIRGILDGRGVAAEELPPSKLEKLKVWRNRGLMRWRELVADGADPQSAESLGYYTVAYQIDAPLPGRTLSEVHDLLDRATVRHTGWSPWWVPTRNGIRPYIHDDTVECYLGDEPGHWLADPAHTDFWRVTAEGQALLVRGFDEDSIPDRLSRGKGFDITMPVWRIAECFLQAASFTKQLSSTPAPLTIMVTWTGLQGRELVHIEGRRLVYPGQISRQNTFERSLSIMSDKIEDQLPELLFEFLLPLYALFDFFKLPKQLVDEEVRRLRSNHF
ncbi:AlbA family DNA-binding domain-containing protein [Azospirillum largimobile]